MSSDRRETLRVPEDRLITEIVSERPNVANVVNVSCTGLYTIKPTVSRLRGPRKVQLEIPLPEASESVWALGEVVFERLGQSCVGSGIRFVAMADRHERLLRDMVEVRRQGLIRRMMRELDRQKDLARYPSPFSSSLTDIHEDTVKMYLMPQVK